MAGFKTWAVGEEVLAVDFQGYVADQTVPRFATTAERDAAWSGSPPAGALCFVTGVGWQRRYAGAWGTYLDAGAGLLPVKNGQNSGTLRGGNSVVTTAANGTFQIPHNMGAKPSWAVVLCADRASAGAAFWVACHDANTDATNLDCQAILGTGAAVASKSIRVYWCAGLA